MNKWEAEALHFYQEQKFTATPKDIQFKIANFQHQQAIVDSAYEKTKTHYAQLTTDPKIVDMNTEMLYEQIRQPIAAQVASHFDAFSSVMKTQLGEQFKNFKIGADGPFVKLNDLDERCQAILTPVC